MGVPRNFVPAVEKGLSEALRSGGLAGYPIVDMKVRFYDGKSHDVDSSEMGFKIAASMCLKKAMQDASPTILEPYYMEVEVTVLDEVMGDVIRLSWLAGLNPRGPATWHPYRCRG